MRARTASEATSGAEAKVDNIPDADSTATGSVNFAEWSTTPIWRDAKACIGHMSQSYTGTLGNPRIREAGRQFLADLLVQLTDHHLTDQRRRPESDLADVTLVHGNVTPPQHLLSLGGNCLLDQLLQLLPPVAILRQVAHARAVAAGSGQLDADRGPEEFVRQLQQDPGAVAGVGICALGATMLEVLQGIERLLHDRVARLTAQLCHQRDAAGIVLVVRVVEASGPRGSETLFHGRRSAGRPGDRGRSRVSDRCYQRQCVKLLRVSMSGG